MKTNIVVTGAKGRMGTTIAGLVKQNPELSLAGVVERQGNVEGLEQYNCMVSDNLHELLTKNENCVVIDFTSPEVSMDVAAICADTGAAAVMGTTGFSSEELEKLEKTARQVRLFWAPNMSVGINVLLRILPELINMLGDKYDLELMEIHHKFKKDAPSGTALKLAQVLAASQGLDLDEKGVFCRKGIIGERQESEIGVQTLRGGDVVGDHTVYLLGPGERIEVTHRAHSRETFAQGAIRAASWLVEQKPGKLYTMADIFA
ncbi:4-hydroxy-tetrahydrodipicolinate reductase [Desulfonatronovibrio magnus]|uniref:4-hydroxy-tetrahydrodipicolinate reductase n=1 Tax=Desulfonatronovibrio magnus TaxID=698827 RepID=UPI0005EBD7F3|nr:4-hydroxy-tetrahydrodipicolinate reductase [Desulfonatronovibrio magnus]